MKIVFQTNNILPVKTYGGTERIIFWLMVHLKELGHQPVLIGNPNSLVEDYGIELIKYDSKTSSCWESLVPKDADIIHLSYNYKFKQLQTPCLFTIHGNGQVGETFPLNSVFVSKQHANNHNCDSFVYNGINFDEYPITRKKNNINWDNFLFLAKASWRIKNLKSCLKACKTAKKSLNIVGGRSFLPSRYVINHGFKGGSEKNKIIQHSDALLFPVKWEEPFGLAIIEAMGYGLPVIGSSYGSLPELITEETGIICQNEMDFISSVEECPRTFEPRLITEYARENYSSLLMAKNYLTVYEKILRRETLNETQPIWSSPKKATDPLEF
jgi:glycosyltransferase involved in cell wall biosynthesis